MSLGKVERAAAKAVRSRAALEQEIRTAHKTGTASLRDISKAAGISHESVRRILRADS